VNRLLVEGAYDEGDMWTTVLVEVATGSLEREPDALTGPQNVVAGHVDVRVVDEASAGDFGGVDHAPALLRVEHPHNSEAGHDLTVSPSARPVAHSLPAAGPRVSVQAVSIARSARESTQRASKRPTVQNARTTMISAITMGAWLL